MAIREIVHYPHPVLSQPAKPVAEITPAIQELIDDMFETMYVAHGVGLAATQIGISLQIAVIDPIGDKKFQLVLINPEIIETRGKEKMQEGCLSVPHHYDAVERATWVKIRALDRNGKSFEMEDGERLAHIFQHEIDHLNGTLYIDKLSPLRKSRFKKKYKPGHKCDHC